MNINSEIFRAYDIRGIYPEDINAEIAKNIGRAFAGVITKSSGSRIPRIIVGRDMRLSSPELAEAFTEGAVSCGAIVDVAGLCTVDMVYFAVGKLRYDGGVMITASHNPKEYGGMKMVAKGMKWIRIKDIQDEIERMTDTPVSSKGYSRAVELWDEYIQHVCSFFDSNKIRPLKVVVDAGNGMAGVAIEKLQKHIPIEIIKLNFEPDGNFPNRPSNPLAENATNMTVSKVLETNADFGVLFDGDTDRLIFIDEKGGFIRADTTLIILAEFFLKKHPGKAVSYNAICSRAVPEFIRKFGGRPIRTKVGFVNVSKGISENDGVLGGEVSAHYSFADNFYADSGIIAFAVMLEIISESEIPLSEMVRGYKPYVRGDEVNLEMENKQEIISILKDKYSDADIDMLDGITVSFPDWWFNVRASNTEPLLRVTVEAGTQEEMENRRDEIVALIKKLSKSPSRITGESA